MTTAPVSLGSPSETGRLARVVLKHARDAFRDQSLIDRQWRDLNFTVAPELPAALVEYDGFVDAIESAGVEVSYLPSDPALTLDSIYVRDASIVTPAGFILSSMGKPQRRQEPAAQAAAFKAWGLPVLGAIEPPGRLEGGDLVWLDARTVAVGWGYRTNDDGIRQLRELLGDMVDALIVVPLPHWRGPSDVFHLMSILSPVDRDLAVVYAPLMPVPFRSTLLDRGYQFVEVPDDEFESMGANVLALAPRRCLMLDGNPTTRARLEHAGVEVTSYKGTEISVKGGGGPTCLTRPVIRASVQPPGANARPEPAPLGGCG